MRETFKSIARGAAFVAAIPSLASFFIRAAVMGRDRALEGSTQMLACLPGVTGQYVRRAFLARVLDRCAPTATISFGTIFSKTGAKLDDHVYVGAGCTLGLVHVERDVLIGSGVHITSGAVTHGIEDASRPIREQEGQPTLVRIGANTWIGSGAIVMADVGPNSVIGAGAVVTRPVPKGVVAAGVPATVLRART